MKLILTILTLIFSITTVHANSPPMPSLAPMLKEVMPAVVHIKTELPPARQQSEAAPITPTPPPGFAMGSGVIVDAKQGYILTNHHVISDATEITVALSDGRSVKAKLIGSDPLSDIAVLQIQAPNLVATPLGNSDNLQVGDYVVAIGNPFGLTQSVTSGIVSALGRNDLGIEGYEDFIQTDASINPGNSGGALINIEGQLIGINTAILASKDSNSSIGIGFAIPINMAQSLMLQLIKFGEVRRGLLGIVAQTITPELAQAFDFKTTKGTLVTHVVSRSLAEKAGIMPGDILMAINDRAIASPSSMRNAVGLIPVGDTLSLKLWRDNNEKTLQITMVDPKTLTSLAEEIHPGLAGVELGEINEDLLGQGHVKGLRILGVYPGSPAAQEGLKPGDIIVLANKNSVSTIQELRNAI